MPTAEQHAVAFNYLRRLEELKALEQEQAKLNDQINVAKRNLNTERGLMQRCVGQNITTVILIPPESKGYIMLDWYSNGSRIRVYSIDGTELFVDTTKPDGAAL